MTRNEHTENETMPEYRHPMQQAVASFHRAFGHPDLILSPQALPADRIKLRVSLIREEGVDELRDAVEKITTREIDHPANVIDALIDALYVSLGGLVEMGEEVQGLPLENSPSWPGLAVLSVATATASSIESSLADLEAALVVKDQAESARLFSAIAQDCHQALLWMGFDPQPFFDEVQRANMSKLGADGRPVYSRGIELDGYPEGKIMKGPGYRAPDLARVYRELYTDQEN